MYKNRYVVTELCRGTLEDYVKGNYQGPRFQDEKEILRQVTQGLAHLHSKEIVHRDIKPTNILIFVPDGCRSRPQAKLADFGLSKILSVDRLHKYERDESVRDEGMDGPRSVPIRPIRLQS